MKPLNYRMKHSLSGTSATVFHLFSSRVVALSILALLAFGVTSCNSQKRLAKKQAKEARLAQIEQAKADLLEIINDDGKIPFEVKERKFNAVKALNLDDKEVRRLLPIAEEKLAKDRVEWLRQKEEDLRRREAEMRERERMEQEKRAANIKIQSALTAVATASDLRTANIRISEALQLFASPDVPLLILISQEGNIRDYDRPTTIQKYLELLKDQRRYSNDIENVLYDAAGKITELELRKR